VLHNGCLRNCSNDQLTGIVLLVEMVDGIHVRIQLTLYEEACWRAYPRSTIGNGAHELEF
jgi:hypothetical protein